MSLQGKQLTSKEPRSSEEGADPGNTQAERSMVRIDSLLPGDSPRLSGADKTHVKRLAEASVRLPPIIVHRPTMRIIDGTHRVHAVVLNGKDEIEAEFFDGSDDEAFVRAVELNVTHGLPLTMAERKLAAARIIASRPDLSDRAVAQSSGLSDKTVAGIRRSAADSPQPNARRGRDGRTHPVDGSDGRRRARQALATRPDAPLREVARIAGISVSTAKDVRDRLKRGEGPLLPERKKPADRSPPVSAPSSRMRNASASSRPDSADRDISFILEKLRKDPSLRFNDSGRELLRLLQLQCAALGKLPQLTEGLPDHCTDMVVQFACQCAEEWDAAAETLQKRSTLRRGSFGKPPAAGAEGC
jgi:ParB-like chromosome segregation protein Spo0J